VGGVWCRHDGSVGSDLRDRGRQVNVGGDAKLIADCFRDLFTKVHDTELREDLQLEMFADMEVAITPSLRNVRTSNPSVSSRNRSDVRTS
jgi:hypothetical protein